MSERSQINIRVDSELKDEWREYVEDNREFQTLTDLIRTAVIRHIDGANQGVSADEITVDADTSEIEQSLNHLTTAIGDLSEDVDVVKRNVTSGGHTRPVDSLLYEQLPEGNGPEEGTVPRALARAFGARVQDVSNALDDLASRRNKVRRSSSYGADGETYYWVDPDREETGEWG